ncbi:MAG TPA: GNAT family N-acetyltransferase [Streptosporangiaceae bacterium]|nr:GNAT family N-acetyltransferase [Streptosporangiaceae bacterium]
MFTKCTITFSRGAAGPAEYQVDDDPARVDAGAAVAFLTTQAYWGRWRDAGLIREQIAAAWRVVAAYDSDGAMVGFARAFSDGATAYLADVYVLPAHRGAGLGMAIVRSMVEEGAAARMRWMLHTADAHGLYRRLGFAAGGGGYLERPRPADAGPGPAPVPGTPRAADPLDTGPLAGEQVRLEPLGYQHAAGLLAASSGGGDLYRWMGYLVPHDEQQARSFIEVALRARDDGAAVPYAVVRRLDGSVIGSTRFHGIEFWPWQLAGVQPDGLRTPDVAEIGWTWLGKDAIRTAANTEMKQLMLTHAFESWHVQSVCLHADARNHRSRAAIERIGAQFEGVLRSHRLAADLTPRDSARYSITAGQWPEVKQHLAGLVRRPR